jgi:hypothetical protein
MGQKGQIPLNIVSDKLMNGKKILNDVKYNKNIIKIKRSGENHIT